MERKFRFAQYGCGVVAPIIIQYMVNKGAEPVAIIDRNLNRRGKMIEEVWDCGVSGIRITEPENAVKVLRETKPDICIIATRSSLEDVIAPFENCAKAGVSAITTSEETVFPSISNPDGADYLDKMAKEAGVVFSASGFPDTYWGSLVTTLAGSVNVVDRIKGYCIYSAYGETLAADHGVGLSQEEFEKKFGMYNRKTPEEQLNDIRKGKLTPSNMWYQNYWLCSNIGLTVKKHMQLCRPFIAEKDVYSDELNRRFTTGTVIGAEFTALTETEEGPVLESTCASKVFSEDDQEYTIWEIEGEPSVSMRFDMKDANYQTCSNLINRIPDILSCKPGFVTTDKLENARYLTRPIGTYVHGINK